MKNPWQDLPKDSWILPIDAQCIYDYNNKYNSLEFEIHYELPPEPYLGNINAPIVLLALNPGYSGTDYKFMIDNHSFSESMKKTRLQIKQKYPFYHLNPKFQDNPGLLYWNNKFKHILNIYTAEQVANSILLLEYFPYKSKSFKICKETKFIPSHEYARFLLKRAMDRKALVICLRSRKYWIDSLPELENYSELYFCNSPRNPILSINNIGESAYNKLITAIKIH